MSASIDNTATVSGSFLTRDIAFSDDASVPVATADPLLDILKTAGEPTKALGADPEIFDAGDTITYSFTITNSGNVTLSDVTPVDDGPSFNGIAGENTATPLNFILSDGFDTTLSPGESAEFTAVYTLTALDILRASGIPDGIANTAYAQGALADETVFGDPENTAEAVTSLEARSALNIDKTYEILDGDDEFADFGERILYSYAVTNTGDVALNDIQISDTHEGAPLDSATILHAATPAVEGPLGAADGLLSVDTNEDPSVWGLLQPGATVIFTYEHHVTQKEVNDG